MEIKKYYKRKLSKEGKKAYDILLRGLTNHLSIIVIPTNLPKEAAGEIANAVDFDNPQLYFVNFGALGIQTIDEPDLPKCWGIYGAYHMSEEECKRIDRIISKETNIVINESVKEVSFEARYWKLYNWLLKRCVTGWCEEYRNQFPDAEHSIIGPMILKETVCEGYAKAFKYLCDKLNEKLPEKQKFECIVAAEYDDAYSGNNIDHAWNIIIKNNAERLHCDLAYEPNEEKRHGRYFMISEEELHRKRKIDKNEASISHEICDNMMNRKELIPAMFPMVGAEVADVIEEDIDDDTRGSIKKNDNKIVINGNINIIGDLTLNFYSFSMNSRGAYQVNEIESICAE